MEQPTIMTKFLARVKQLLSEKNCPYENLFWVEDSDVSRCSAQVALVVVRLALAHLDQASHGTLAQV